MKGDRLLTLAGMAGCVYALGDWTRWNVAGCNATLDYHHRIAPEQIRLLTWLHGTFYPKFGTTYFSLGWYLGYGH